MPETLPNLHVGGSGASYVSIPLPSSVLSYATTPSCQPAFPRHPESSSFGVMEAPACACSPDSGPSEGFSWAEATLSSYISSSGPRGENEAEVVEKEELTTLQKRARSKMASNGLAHRLSQVEGSPLRQAYINTMYCASVMQEDLHGRVTSKYCKNRWCITCNRIQTAKNMNRYLPIIEQWSDKWFVTLTPVSPTAENLKAVIEQMKDVFRQIRKKIDKQFRGGQRTMMLEALRKLETTHNPETNTYHPHFHNIVHGKENADFLLEEWLRLMPGTSRLGQQCVPADDDSVRELFKYFSKLTSGPKGDGFVDVDALDVIFRAVRGDNVFQPYGIRPYTAAVLPEAQKEQIEEVGEDGLLPLSITAQYNWVNKHNDWVERDHGVVLSGYVPTDRWATFVKARMFDSKRRELPDEAAVLLPLPALPARPQHSPSESKEKESITQRSGAEVGDRRGQGREPQEHEASPSPKIPQRARLAG